LRLQEIWTDRQITVTKTQNFFHGGYNKLKNNNVLYKTFK